MLPGVLGAGAGEARRGDAAARVLVTQVVAALVAQLFARPPRLDFDARREEFGQFIGMFREIKTAAHRHFEIAQAHLGDARTFRVGFADRREAEIDPRAAEEFDQAGVAQDAADDSAGNPRGRPNQRRSGFRGRGAT